MQLLVAGFRYPHKVRRRHVVTGTSGRHVVSPPDALSPRDGSAAELAAAAAAPYTQARGGPPGSPALSEEGQSWQEASFPAAEAFSTPGTLLNACWAVGCSRSLPSSANSCACVSKLCPPESLAFSDLRLDHQKFSREAGASPY